MDGGTYQLNILEIYLIFEIIMKRIFLISSVLLIVLFFSCTKVEKVRTSGIDTIDNTTFFTTTYFVYGFTFSQAKLVPTYPAPGPDVTLYVNKDNQPYRLTLQASNLKPSFYKVGDYGDSDAAISAFDNLKTVSVPQWLDMADPINDNQVWIYRTGTEKYAKIRIISTINENRQGVDYGECTFQWVFQPDGSTSFPDK
jgi:hypothetical protein